LERVARLKILSIDLVWLCIYALAAAPGRLLFAISLQPVSVTAHRFNGLSFRAAAVRNQLPNSRVFAGSFLSLRVLAVLYYGDE